MKPFSMVPIGRLSHLGCGTVPTSLKLAWHSDPACRGHRPSVRYFGLWSLCPFVSLSFCPVVPMLFLYCLIPFNPWNELRGTDGVSESVCILFLEIHPFRRLHLKKVFVTLWCRLPVMDTNYQTTISNTWGRIWQSSWYSWRVPACPPWRSSSSSQHLAEVRIPMARRMTKGPVAPSSSSQKSSRPTLGRLSTWTAHEFDLSVEAQ